MISIKKPIAKLHKSETRLGLEVKKKTVKSNKITAKRIELKTEKETEDKIIKLTRAGKNFTVIGRKVIIVYSK